MITLAQIEHELQRAGIPDLMVEKLVWMVRDYANESVQAVLDMEECYASYSRQG